MSNRLLQPKKTTQRIVTAGTNRGARRALNTLRDLAKDTTRYEVEVVGVDCVPGRAESYASEARAAGLNATAVESRIESFVNDEGRYAGEPLILNLDRASSIAETLVAIEQHPAPVLIYLVIVDPRGRLMGLRMVIRPEESPVRAKALAFFRSLANVSARAGARAIFGEGSDPAHVALEGAIRGWFAIHQKDNLGKLLGGLEPESPPYEVTFDGASSLPLHVVETSDFGNPVEVVTRVASAPESTLARGERFVVAEVGPAALRLHESYRHSNKPAVVVRESTTIDELAMMERTETAPQVVSLLREMRATPSEPREGATTAPTPSASALRNEQLARDSALVFSTTTAPAPDSAPTVRTNEFSRTSPVRTTD